MCGLVGIAARYTNGFTNKEVDMFRDMLFVDTLRGWDSTGVFGVNRKGNVSIKKAAITGPQFITTQEYKNFQSDLIRDGVFACGHNRAATRGTINDKNAHPFWVDDKIILMQNGTMVGDHKKHKDVEVDSEAIAHVLSECNGDVEKAMQKIDAAFALVWYNTETEELNLLRNDERPLYISYFNDHGMVWASEPDTILWAASRADIKLKMEPYLLKDHHLVTLKLGDGGKYTMNSKDVDTKYKGAPFLRGHNNYAAYGSGGHHAFGYGAEYEVDRTSTTVERPVRETLLLPDAQRKSNVLRTFGDMLASDASLAQYLFDDMLSAQKACKEIMSQRDDHLRVIVEPIDFIPANVSTTEVRDWYLFGWVPQTNSTVDSEVPLVYWFVKDKSVQDMIEFAHNRLFQVEIRTSIVQALPHKKAVSAMFYGHNPEPLAVN